MSEQLSNLATIHYGKSPSEVLEEGGSFPIIGTGGKYGQANRAMFNGPAVVIARKGSLGNPQLLMEPFWPADTTYAAIPQKDVDASWLYYNLLNFDLTKLNEATGVPSISRDWLNRIRFFNPSKEHKRKIGEILQTVDVAIEKTESLITKYQQIKVGLMHDLFTRGVTADGKLRPSREQAPELYQETPIGWIPKEWKVETINSLAVRVGSGITPTGGSNVYLTEGTIFIRSQNVTHEGLDLSDVAFINEKTHRGMAASEVFPFDVLLNITGASIGRCCYLPDGLGPTNTNQHVCCIRIAKPNEADAKFLSAVLSSPIGQNQIFRLNAGGNREGLNYQQLRSFIVPWPLQDERLRIAVRLNSTEGYISEERQLLGKLRQQKHGLMHDLLTGRVRVPEDIQLATVAL